MKRFAWLLIFLTGCAPYAKTLPVVARPPESASEETASVRRAPVVLTDSHILKRLGPPDVKRAESPDEVWVYRQNACILYIYLKEPYTESSHVAHMEIGAPTENDAERDATACLKMAARL